MQETVTDSSNVADRTPGSSSPTSHHATSTTTSTVTTETGTNVHSNATTTSSSSSSVTTTGRERRGEDSDPVAVPRVPSRDTPRGSHSKDTSHSSSRTMQDLEDRLAYKTGIMLLGRRGPEQVKKNSKKDKQQDGKTNKSTSDSDTERMDSSTQGISQSDDNFDVEGAGEEGRDRLAVAIEVDEDQDENYIPAAIEYDPDAKPPMYKNRRFRLYSVLACLLAVVLLAGILGIVGENKKGNNRASGSDISASDKSDSPFQDILEQFELVVGAEALNDPSTSEYLAKEWILNKDPLQLTTQDSNLVQRFLLAVVYFKLHEQGDWLSCNAPTEENPEDFCLFQKLVNIFPMEYRSISWYRWLSGDNECSWAGIFCDEFNQVRSIDLVGQNITGSLPVELTYFPFLQGLVLSWNELTGTLPTEFGGLPHLLSLELHYNNLEGSIPNEWTKAKNLQQLNLGANELSGTLPERIGDMSNLKGLFLFENLLSGSIPSSFGSLSLLTYVRMQRNMFTGQLPSEIALSALRELWLHRTAISGTIPSQVANMDDLLDFRLHRTAIEGTIPEELWNLTNLFRLDLFDTNIAGTLSPNIAQLSQLGILRLRNTEMTGTIPTELASLEGLSRVWLEGNEFTGSVPDAICDLRGPDGVEELVADCLAPINGTARVECLCCDVCCDYETGVCA